MKQLQSEMQVTPAIQFGFDLMEQIPIIDLSNDSSDANCTALAESLKKYGVVIVRDASVDETSNNRFLQTMHDYFSQPDEIKLKDARPQFNYQFEEKVGVTPERVETPRCLNDPASCQSYIDSLKPEDKPLHISGADVKWRYFWRVGERPAVTEYPELNAEDVQPEGFPKWTEVMNDWGNRLVEAVSKVSMMLAIGLGLPKTTFSDLAKNGPHLLAPTATNLSKYGQLNAVYAGFHYDLNMLTIHGKSNFPGLQIWTREGKKMDVAIPDGCLLVQAGKQMEMLTNGIVHAGYHQVVCTEKTIAAIKAAQRNSELWRISSTLFFHVASDQYLKSYLGKSDTMMKAGDQVELELKAIALSQ